MSAFVVLFLEYRANWLGGKNIEVDYICQRVGRKTLIGVSQLQFLLILHQNLT